MIELKTEHIKDAVSLMSESNKIKTVWLHQKHLESSDIIL